MRIYYLCPFCGHNEINSAYRTFLERLTSLKNLKTSPPAPSQKKSPSKPKQATTLRTILVYLKVFFKKQTKKQCTVFIYFHVYHLEEERAGVKIWRESHGSPPQKYKLSFLSLSPREEVWKTFTESVFVWYDGWKLEHFQRGIYMHTVALVFNSVLKKHYNQILRKKQLKIFTSLSQNEEKQKKV